MAVGLRVAAASAASATSAAHPAASSASRAQPSAATAVSPARAPSGPPLTQGTTGEAGTVDTGEDGTGASGEGGAESTQAQADPLVSNGLASPTCRGMLAGELSPTSRQNCETSGFVASPAPTGNYGIDVHIDTGFLGLGTGAASSAVQDLIVSPLWMALVWAVHALIVMLEWCFTLDLLDGSQAVSLGASLRHMQATFTAPWMPIALACASVLVLYHGLVRRRVAHTLGEALMTMAMMAAGLWIVVDPTGTVGALGEWADQASLGTLAVAAGGAPYAPGRQLSTSLEALFATAIEGPWCFLEFGDVAWCRDPSRLDPRLRAAAAKIADTETSEISCVPGGEAPTPCTPAGGTLAKALRHSAELLRDARSNGAIFLALPANGAARNSINQQGSLLRTLCQSSEATDCRGSTAAQAEFRTAGETLARLGGLLLIAAGLLGMILLLGFIGVRLLLAAIFSLLYLLLAPAAVLTPAFGEGGRTLFRRWAARLLGAVVSKLLFAFLLGVVLAILAIVSALGTLGWWTQWLLMSAFWWGAFTHRHDALGAAGGVFAESARSGAHVRERTVLKRLGAVLEPPRRGVAAVRWTRGRLTREAPPIEPRKLLHAGRSLARAGGEEQVDRVLEHEHRDARVHAGAAADIQRALAQKRSRLARIEHARAEASSAGQSRRAAVLEHRAAGLREEIAARQRSLSGSQRIVRERESAERRTGRPHTLEQRERWQRFLDAQAELPAGGRRAPTGQRRDYAALAGLAGHGRREYEGLDASQRRSTHLEIDRQLALRKARGEVAATLADEGGEPHLRRREQRHARSGFEDAVSQRMQARGQSRPAYRAPRSELDRWREQGRAAADAAPPRHSDVMSDAREVAARRKRQLGRDNP
ncbi:MAG TPA: hypothetical protein VKV16_03345, partial [Solirubrobacteraceae bacterium]|nr:hypothetical protein [Solirubrobacteraceae bacterium]